MSFTIHPIGSVSHSGTRAFVQLDPEFAAALKRLDQFSHVFVLWWAHKHDNNTSRAYRETEPPYAPGKVHGIFATRAEYRPNPIAMTICEVLAVDVEAGRLEVRAIDAIEGTPVIDIKPYYPVCDRVKKVRTPAWISDWPDWFPVEGFGLD